MRTETTLKRTPLFNMYIKYGAKTVAFGGWELPVQFSSILEEHAAVRKEEGLFDVSHMGEVLIEGKDAESYINYLVTNDVTKMKKNGVQYTAMCYPDGGTIDDLLVYKLNNDKYLLVINAANIEKDMEWMRLHIEGDVKIEDISNEMAQLAIQGPKAEQILQKRTRANLSEIGFLQFAQHVSIAGIPDVLVSRTGYTGEDGFELYLAASKAEELWEKLLDTGKEAGLKPCGLGARDILRFEACLALYGQELTNEISPLEAGIGFAVKINKESQFIGKTALSAQKGTGLKRKLTGIEVTGRGIPRYGYRVFSGEKDIGLITSGMRSPSLQKNLGLALLSPKYTDPGTELQVEIRNKKVDAVVINTPFYKRG